MGDVKINDREIIKLSQTENNEVKSSNPSLSISQINHDISIEKSKTHTKINTVKNTNSENPPPNLNKASLGKLMELFSDKGQILDSRDKQYIHGTLYLAKELVKIVQEELSLAKKD